MIRDWFDYVGFILNAVAAAGGLFGLFLAIVAYRSAKEEGRKSRELVARERRTTFELEVLRDLLELLDRTDLLGNVVERGGRALQLVAATRLVMLPENELATWRTLAKMDQKTTHNFMGFTPPRTSEYFTKMRELLVEDVLASIKHRMEH